MFKNSSGDEAYPICILDIELTEEEKRKIIINNIGDDYYEEDDEICGHFWVETINEKASNLLGELNV